MRSLRLALTAIGLLALLILAGGLLSRGKNAAPMRDQRVLLLTGLPIIWGQGAVEDVLGGKTSPAAAYRWLAENYTLEPVDRITPENLSRNAVALLAQPRALDPEALVALDGWVRGGGRAFIFADPLLRWPAHFPLGDRRAPPAMTLLDPLLDHWGLRLDLQSLDPRAPVETRSLAGGNTIALRAPGVLHSSNSACTIEGQGLVARCTIDKGAAIIVADADLFADALWQHPNSDAPAAIAGWLATLGKSRDKNR